MAASIRSGYWSRNLRVHTLNHNCKSKREKKNTECWWGFLLLKPDSSDVFPLARPYVLNLPIEWQHLGSHVQKPEPMGNNSPSASQFLGVHYYNCWIDWETQRSLWNIVITVRLFTTLSPPSKDHYPQVVSHEVYILTCEFGINTSIQFPIRKYQGTVL